VDPSSPSIFPYASSGSKVRSTPKSRHVEALQSITTAAIPVNHGERPTLKHSRKELALTLHRSGDFYQPSFSPKQGSVFNKILQDVVSHTTESRSAPTSSEAYQAHRSEDVFGGILKMRKKYWRRELSEFPTEHFDLLWNGVRETLLVQRSSSKGDRRGDQHCINTRRADHCTALISKPGESKVPKSVLKRFDPTVTPSETHVIQKTAHVKADTICCIEILEDGELCDLTDERLQKSPMLPAKSSESCGTKSVVVMNSQKNGLKLPRRCRMIDFDIDQSKVSHSTPLTPSKRFVHWSPSIIQEKLPFQRSGGDSSIKGIPNETPLKRKIGIRYSGNQLRDSITKTTPLNGCKRSITTKNPPDDPWSYLFVGSHYQGVEFVLEDFEFQYVDQATSP
jgi:hypothetical protein